MLRFIALLFSTLILFAIVGVAGVLGVFWHYGRDLPDYHQLAHYEPSVTTRVYAGDGRLVAEYAVEKRSFVPFAAMPQRVINAFLAAEDKNFYTHSGVDPIGIARAVIVNLRNRGMGGDRRPAGASTITQQVAKNFLLSNEVSLERKIKEAILAFRIERTFSKQHILELYLNEIYLGQGSYGVAAAALNYFDKGLDELSIAEAAYLGALPKGPNNYNPSRNYQAAKERRDWVIGRMVEDGYISATPRPAPRKASRLPSGRAARRCWSPAASISPRISAANWPTNMARTRCTRAACRCARPSIRRSRRSPPWCCAMGWSPMTGVMAGVVRLPGSIRGWAGPSASLRCLSVRIFARGCRRRCWL